MTNILRGFSWLVIGGFVALAATALPASAAKGMCGAMGGSRVPCVPKQNCTCTSMLALDGMCYFGSCKKELTCAQMGGSLKPCPSKAGCDCTSTKASDGICFFESCRSCPDVPGPFCIDTVVDDSETRYIDALAVDPQNLLLYYNDEFHNAVYQYDFFLRKSKLFAGNKKVGCSGDGGPATSARLVGSIGMTVSPGFNVPSWGQFGQGYLFIADTDNHRIRVIAPGPRGASGDIASLDTDPLQASCTGQNTPWNQDPPPSRLTYKGPPGRLALLGLASDGQGNLVGTNSDGQIYKITLPDQNVSVIAGQPMAGRPASGVPGPASKAILFDPRSPIIDTGTGALFFIEMGRNRIDKLDAAGNISIVAGSADGTGGPPDPDGTSPAQAHFLFPRGLAMDSAGNIYVADTQNNVIRVIDQRANEVCTVKGTGGFWSATEIGAPLSVAVYEPQSGGRTGLPRIFLSDASHVPPASPDPVSSAVRVIFPCPTK